MNPILRPFTNHADVVANPDTAPTYGYLFFCPGCECAHQVRVKADPTQPGLAVWGWNGNVEKPTFTPSILVNGNVHLLNPTVPRCHTYVTDGNIQFLGDCTHKLAGQTVPLAPWPY